MKKLKINSTDCLPIKLVIAIILIFFISCNDENPVIITTNIFHTQENSINHLKLEISSSASWLKHNETLNFTSDSILVTLKIIGLEEGSGTGDVHLYTDKSTTFAAFYFNRDTFNNRYPFL